MADIRAVSAPSPRDLSSLEHGQAAAVVGAPHLQLVEERTSSQARRQGRPGAFTQSAMTPGRHGRRKEPHAPDHSDAVSSSEEEEDDAASIASIGDVEYAAMLESLQEHLGAVAGALHEALVLSAAPGTRSTLGPRPCTPPAVRRARRRSKDRTFDAPMLQPTDHHNTTFEKELRRRREAARAAEEAVQSSRDGSGRSGRGSAKARPLIRSEEHVEEILSQMAAVRGHMREDYAKALQAKVVRQRREKRERAALLERRRQEEYERWSSLAQEDKGVAAPRSENIIDNTFLKHVPKSRFYHEVAAAQESEPQPSRRERIQAYQEQLRSNPPPVPTRLPPIRKQPEAGPTPAAHPSVEKKNTGGGATSSWALTGEPDDEEVADAQAHNARSARGWLERPQNHISQNMYPTVLPKSVDGEPVDATDAGSKPLAEYGAQQKQMRERAKKIRRVNTEGTASVKAFTRKSETWDGTPALAQPRSLAREALGAKHNGTRDSGHNRKRAAAAEAARTVALTEVGTRDRRAAQPLSSGGERQGSSTGKVALDAGRQRQAGRQTGARESSSLGKESASTRREPAALTLADAESTHPTRAAKARVWTAQTST